MGYYKDLRSALNSTKMGDKTSKEYKLVMEARKPLMDILFYHQDEPSHYDERIEFIDGKLLSNIGNWGTPGLVKKVYNQICKYRPDIFDGISVQPSNPNIRDAYKSKCTMSFRESLYRKCDILHFIDDDFIYEAYTYHFDDVWGTPWNWLVMKYAFYRKYLVEYSHRTGEGFYEKTLHNPERLLKDLDDVPKSYGLEESKDAIRNCLIEASKYKKIKANPL